LRLVRQAFNALASFCARVSGFGLAGAAGERLPAPESDTVPGAGTNGLGSGVPWQASPKHGGSELVAVMQGLPVCGSQIRAS